MIGFFLTLGLALTIYLYWESWSYALLVAGLAFAVGIAIVIYNDGSKIEKDRILVTYIAFLIVIVFWGAFEQAGGCGETGGFNGRCPRGARADADQGQSQWRSAI